MKNKRNKRLSRTLCVGLAALCLWLRPCEIHGELPKTPAPEGCSHGYLILRDLTKKVVGSGEFTQVAQGNQMTARLLFRFKDGSVDDETTVFTQNRGFHLISDRHVQSGPSFPHPLDAWIDTALKQVRFREQDGTLIKTETMELPADLSNGLVLTMIKHMGHGASSLEIPYLAEVSKPRLMKLSITRDGESRFRVGPFFHRATRYLIKVELGGLAGIVAPMIGKQPANSFVWIAGGEVPAIVRVDAPLFDGGPVLTIEPATPVW